MAFPTFPQSWTPPTSCFETTNIYAVITYRDPEDTDIVGTEFWYGVPTTVPTGNCIPPSYGVSAPYFGQSCPPSYRVAVAKRTMVSNQDASATICCPGFDVRGTEGCESVFGDQTFFATYTDNTIGEERAATFSDVSGETLSAFAITLVSMSETASTISSASPTSSRMLPAPTTTKTSSMNPTSAPDHSSLSTGAAAGIGIGATAGAISLFILGWLFYRKHAKKTPEAGSAVNSAPRPEAATGAATGVSLPKEHESRQTPQQDYHFHSPDNYRSVSELPATTMSRG
ncbi:hypothetical protein F5Y18DRAFT_427003 [Xylariaceae sp. FL1019]|nr:hypothetical protein F5Y18DRAFT_427003 [Xylariaceae sp. FL1019]